MFSTKAHNQSPRRPGSNNGVGRRWWSPWRLCAVAVATTALAAAPAGAQTETDDAGVKVSAHDTVDITVQDTDLAQVLQMLSIQSQKNIIVSKSVSGTVTANLYNVTFYEALDSILRVNGYGYFEQGNFLYVHSLSELEEMEQANRSLESKVFDLDYIAAADAYEFAVPMLSERGTAAYRGDVVAGMRPDISDAGADSYAYNAKLLVTDYPENIEAIGKMLDEMDTPPQQVLVESTILQTTLDEANAFGVDFSVIGNIDFTDLTSPLGLVNNLLAGDDADGVQPDDNKAHGFTSSPGNTSGPGTFKVGVVSNDVSVFLKLLDEVTDTYVLARPKVMALNRQRAEVLVGARVGYLSTTATETTTTQTVEFLDTGIQLVFRPFISKNGMIRMELSPSVSEASLRNVTDATGSLVTIPDELTNELTTNVRVRDGETLVLGGLFRESVRTTRRQVPGLGDIPILGAAFRGHEDDVERSEIIFLITPSVVEDEKLWAYGDALIGYSDDVRVGARAGLLPFSRDRLASTNNLKAKDAFERGDTDQAMYYTNLSLHLQPQQPEMVKFREQITGQKVKDHERNLQQRVLLKVLGPMTDRHLVGHPAPIDPDFGNTHWPKRSTSATDPYANDPFQLDTNTDNWDFDTGNSSRRGNGPSIGAGKWHVTPETFGVPGKGDQHENQAQWNTGSGAPFDHDPSASSGISGSDMQGQPFGSPPEHIRHESEATQLVLDTHRRMSMEFLNDLYIALGLPPLTQTSGPTQTGDAKGEFPFETFDDAAGVAEADEENPY